MVKYFGTDGVRGVVNDQLCCELAFRIGQACGCELGKKIFIGRDSRLSGDMLLCALSAGAMSQGAKVVNGGVIPTPGVAFHTKDGDYDCGIVISASHNAPKYNGIKIFNSQGDKLSDEVQGRIEAFIDLKDDCIQSCDACEVGQMSYLHSAVQDYIEYCIASLQQTDANKAFSGLKIVVDPGYGAAVNTTATALRSLGSEVIVINDTLDGSKINVNCGSTHLDQLKRVVVENKAHIGIAHDGDADRVIFVDEQGSELDGDYILALLALDLKRRNLLSGNTVVGTVMCNLGFVKAMQKADITLVQTDVGDKNVLQAMRNGGYSLGGEQSGHIVLLDHNTTGDGLMCALHFIAAWKSLGGKLSEASNVVDKYPQVLINVSINKKGEFANNEIIKSEIQKCKDELGEDGRVLVRESGTEPLVRVMVEAKTQDLASRYANGLAEAVKINLD